MQENVTSQQSVPKHHQIVRPLVYVGMSILGVVVLWFFFAPMIANRPAACADLLSTTETEALYDAHQDTINALGSLGANGGMVAERPDCPGKAAILIYHGTVQQASKIRAKLGDTFFGAPYRLVNN